MTQNKIFFPNGGNTGSGSNDQKADNTKLVAGPTVGVSPDGGTTDESFPKPGVEYDFYVNVSNTGTMASGEMNEGYANAKNLVTNNVVTVKTAQSYEGYNKQITSAVYVPVFCALSKKRFFRRYRTML